MKYGQEVKHETNQMNKRVKYFHLTYVPPEDQRVEVPKPCGHCGARLYLEGAATPPAPAPASLPLAEPTRAPKRPLQELAAALRDELVSAQDQPPVPKRPRTGGVFDSLPGFETLLAELRKAATSGED